jgi:hypothetical protein
LPPFLQFMAYYRNKKHMFDCFANEHMFRIL